MKKPLFNNKPNQLIQQDNRDYWISRSIAVVCVLMIIKNKQPYFLIEKRSKNMDSHGLWCVPSGYLDWDENAKECLRREVWEETTIDLEDKDFKKYILYKDDPTLPFFVKTHTGENKQNVTLNYSYAIIYNDQIEKATKVVNDEIDKIKLIHIDELNKYEWAFDHDKRIMAAFKHILNKIKNKYEWV